MMNKEAHTSLFQIADKLLFQGRKDLSRSLLLRKFRGSEAKFEEIQQIVEENETK